MFWSILLSFIKISKNVFPNLPSPSLCCVGTYDWGWDPCHESQLSDAQATQTFSNPAFLVEPAAPPRCTGRWRRASRQVSVGGRRGAGEEGSEGGSGLYGMNVNPCPHHTSPGKCRPFCHPTPNKSRSSHSLVDFFAAKNPLYFLKKPPNKLCVHS